MFVKILLDLFGTKIDTFNVDYRLRWSVSVTQCKKNGNFRLLLFKTLKWSDFFTWLFKLPQGLGRTAPYLKNHQNSSKISKYPYFLTESKWATVHRYFWHNLSDNFRFLRPSITTFCHSMNYVSLSRWCMMINTFYFLLMSPF